MAQLLVEGGEPERNFERAALLVAEAKAQGCDLVLLPETIDFAWTHPSAIEQAQLIPGPFSEVFANLARQHAIWLCVGLTESAKDGKRYNAALLFDSEGNIVLHHRKINLLEVEFPFYDVGQKLETLDTPWGRMGLNICADNYLDSLHLGHALARMGAQVILSPSSWTVDFSVTEADEPYHDKWRKPLGILAGWHNLVVVSTTSVGYIVGGPYEGKKMVGKSLAMGPQGILAEGPMNEFAGELIAVEFDVPAIQRKGTQIGASLKQRGYRFDDPPK
jgi:predicted amidohydrolase